MVAPPAFEVGRTAAELLLDHIQKPLMPRRQVVLETQLIIRSSCGSESAKQNAVA
jgi:DNA-binding LacI/PurR family transcriptional regulator